MSLGGETQVNGQFDKKRKFCQLTLVSFQTRTTFSFIFRTQMIIFLMKSDSFLYVLGYHFDTSKSSKERY